VIFYSQSGCLIVQPNYNLDDMDYGEMAAKIKLVAIDEIRHAEMFAGRIKELGGEPVTEKQGAAYRAEIAGAPSATGLSPGGLLLAAVIKTFL
jgi:rubrerythrin